MIAMRLSQGANRAHELAGAQSVESELKSLTAENTYGMAATASFE